jgi:hypothetical protein
MERLTQSLDYLCENSISFFLCGKDVFRPARVSDVAGYCNKPVAQFNAANAW